MKLYKRGKFYVARFKLHGKLHRISTGISSREDAWRAATHVREQMVLGNLGVIAAMKAPTLRDFIAERFMPYARERHESKPKTLSYYDVGCKMLLDSKLADMRISAIAAEQAAEFSRQYRIRLFSPSGINQGLRTLRRILRLAFDWRMVARRESIPLCSGERQRTRVLSYDEESDYLAACTEPWRTMATLMIEVGPRPGEVLELEMASLNWQDKTVRILKGKTLKAKRTLPMTDKMHAALQQWCGRRTDGWVFPSPDKNGRTHYSNQMINDWHKAALRKCRVEPFEPYCLRHTALTRLGRVCDPFALMTLAGHTSLTTTQRYVHPQKDTILRAVQDKEAMDKVEREKKESGKGVTKMVSGGSKRGFRVIRGGKNNDE